MSVSNSSKKNKLKDYERVLLVNPPFPIKYSKKHKFILPIGLIKIGTYYQNKGANVKLIWLNDNNDEKDLINFAPQIIYITSVFTYYAPFVKEAVEYCKKIFPNVPIIVGGVFASILPNVCKEYTGCDSVIQGIINETENTPLNYDLLGDHKDDFDYQIIHTTRGCTRNCEYCCGHLFEKYSYKKSIKGEITHKKIMFYDNNLLSNPYIEEILNELIDLKKRKIITECEARVGLDYRIINKKPHLATLLKKANFKNIKIAWDSDLSFASEIKQCIDILVENKFRALDIGVYMLSNYDLPYEILEKKRIKCYEYGVKVINCRYIPLDALSDGYNAHKKKQSDDEYYIHPNWTDAEIREFGRNARKNNHCVTYKRKYHTYFLERNKLPKEENDKVKVMTFEEAKLYFKDAWNPQEFHIVKKEDYQTKLLGG